MEIGKLTAVFDADTHKFDAGIASVNAKLTNSITNTNQLSSSLSGLSKNFSLAFGTASIAAIGIGAVTSSLFEAAKGAATFGGHLNDLSQRTGITVGTLSALKVAAENSGSSIETTNKALSRYLGNISAVNSGNEQLRKKFEQAGFTQEDLTKAYKSSDDAVSVLVKKIGGMGSEQDRLNALQKVGIRNGQEFAGVVTEMKGDLEAFRKEAERLGLVITPEQAKEADKFDDTLHLLELQVKGMSYSIAREYLPQISGAMADLSNALASNQGAWASWGEFIRTEIRGARVAATGLAAYVANIGLGSPQAFAVGFAAAVSKSRTLHGEEDLASNIGAGVSIRGGGFGVKPRPRETATGGGGGGGDPARDAQREAELRLKAIVEGLKAEEEVNKRSLDLRRTDFNSYATRYVEIENHRHEAVISGLEAERAAAERLKKGRDVALLGIANKVTEENITHEKNRNKVLDERAKILDQINKFISDQERDIVDVTAQTDHWDQSYQQLVDTLKEEGVVLEKNTESRIKANITRAKELDLILSITRERRVIDQVRDRFAPLRPSQTGLGPSVTDLGGGSVFSGVVQGGIGFPGEGGTGLERQRIVLQDLRDKMTKLAGDITDIWSKSIADGIRGGAKAGLQTLAQGFLSLIQEVILGRLKAAIADALIGTTGGGGGGGFFSGLLRSIIGGAVGGAVGGGGGLGLLGAGRSSGILSTPTDILTSGIIHRASGGPISPGNVYKVHKDELIMPMQDAMVYNKSQQGGTTIINNITMPPVAGNRSYASPQAKREMAQALVAALQGAQT